MSLSVRALGTEDIVLRLHIHPGRYTDNYKHVESALLDDMHPCHLGLNKKITPLGVSLATLKIIMFIGFVYCLKFCPSSF